MKYLVIGCGRVGAELAYRLYSKGHKITVIDNSATNFQNLNPEFRGKTLEGDAMNEEVLHRGRNRIHRWCCSRDKFRHV